MIKLDHLTIAVTDCEKSRDWYIATLGLKLEFEIPERRTSAVQDEFGFTLFLAETPGGPGRPSCVLTFQVSDVEAKHKQLVAAGAQFVHPPQKTFWGYGADLKDPDGYHIWLWDEKSMREKGEAGAASSSRPAGTPSTARAATTRSLRSRSSIGSSPRCGPTPPRWPASASTSAAAMGAT